MSRRLTFELGALALAAALALALRWWAIGIYQIPSPSMLPRLMPGDYLLVEKWPFAVQHRDPRRGDIVILRIGRKAYAKRVIALPGDRVALRAGRLILNDRTVPRWRVADFLFAPADQMSCRAPEPQPDGGPLCRATRYRELPAEGRAYDVLDLGGGDGPDFEPATVPAGHVFVLGDNRDRSDDSRSTLGMVPAEAVIGRAGIILFSTDTRARLSDPGRWWASIRWDRIGRGF